MSQTTNVPGQIQQDYIIPEDLPQMRIRLRQYLNEIASALNYKENNVYVGIETSANQLYLPIVTSGGLQYRSVFRVTVDFGALPNATTKSVPHNIPIDADYTVTHLYGAATDPVTFNFIPIPFAAITDNENIELMVTATDVSITTGIDYSAYTRAQVVIEYLRQVT